MLHVENRSAKQRDLHDLSECRFLRHRGRGSASTSLMSGNPTSGRDRRIASVEPDPILSFVETGALEPQPRLLVDRLLYARALIQQNPVLAPRFFLGECAAAHHIAFADAAAGRAAVARLITYGFRVEPWVEPPGVRFFLSSWHTKPEIRSLLVALTMVTREAAY
jgi:hypothetical protein